MVTVATFAPALAPTQALLGSMLIPSIRPIEVCPTPARQPSLPAASLLRGLEHLEYPDNQVIDISAGGVEHQVGVLRRFVPCVHPGEPA